MQELPIKLWKLVIGCVILALSYLETKIPSP